MKGFKKEIRRYLADKLFWLAFRLDPERFIRQKDDYFWTYNKDILENMNFKINVHEDNVITFTDEQKGTASPLDKNKM